ncbi:HAD family hydrolase [Piscibacillus sp. B03]|uniref:HAD family hydrolase n=1 Tax=Piscibacillus sp. B03 TaxID=3457430 RepID=UPI003FCD2015
MIKAVLFDLDGTLLNRDQSVKSFIQDQYDLYHQWLGHISKDTYINRFIELDERGYVWKDRVYQVLVNEFNITNLTWEDLLEDYITQFQRHCIPFEDLTTMLDELVNTNHLLGIITNGKEQFQLNNIKALGIERYFNTILISEREGIKKPNPEIFYKALNELNVKPHDSMYVGDHPEKDIQAARHIGMLSCWKQSDEWIGVDADYVINQLNELPPILKEINEE